MATETVGTREPAKGKSAFGTPKPPSTIIYRLIKENEKLRPDTPRFPPYKRFPNYDIIQWEDGTRAIRWLPGEASIFVDEQEKNGREIPKNIVENPNNRFEIIDGDLIVKPHEKTKIQFLELCNRNINSKHRTGQTEAVFARYSEEKRMAEIAAKQELQQKAIQLAFKATNEEIASQVKYFGISIVDPDTNETRTEKAIVADYRQYAMDQPEAFLKIVEDPEVKDKAAIEKAIEENIISTTLIPGKAAWVETKEAICDVVAGKTAVDSLLAFGKLRAGEAMMKRVREL